MITFETDVRIGRTHGCEIGAGLGLADLADVRCFRWILDHTTERAAKRRLERTEAPVDKISWQVGYEEPAFFRRLFRRVTGLPPGAYRRRFKIPDYERPRRKS